MPKSTNAVAPPQAAPHAGSTNLNHTSALFTLALLGALYLCLRALAWAGPLAGPPLLEDHDSVGYVANVADLATAPLAGLLALDPSHDPFYLAAAATLAGAGLPAETAARTFSLIASLTLFATLALLGRPLLGMLATCLGLVLVACNPVLIRLSYGVLTEPTYIALVYAGFCLFLWQRRRLRSRWAAALGLVFGLAFLTRPEGVLFLAVVPLLQLLALGLGDWPHGRPWSRFGLWLATFGVVFALVATPYIWLVSSKLGEFALNGRQVWSALMQRPDGMSYEEKIYGLEFSDSTINISYLMANPAALDDSGVKPGLLQYVRLLLVNLSELNYNTLPAFVGTFAVAFIAIGLWSLWKTRGVEPVVLVLAFLAVGLVGPLLHNVVLRHIGVTVPLLLLLAGTGIVAVVEALPALGRASFGARPLASVLLTGLVIVPAVVPLARLYLQPDETNREYRPVELREPVAAIERTLGERSGVIPVVARYSYLTHHLENGRWVPLPFADLAGLQRYMRLNNTEYLYLRFTAKVISRPFASAFVDAPPPGFELLYRDVDRQGVPMALFRYRMLGGD